MATKKTLPYKEGDWIAVPVLEKGYALGRIARSSRSGAIVGYFFAPLRKTLPTEDDTKGLTSQDAVVIYKFGDLGLIKDGWPIISGSNDWHREDWPLPSFGHIDIVDPSKAYRREYDEKNLNRGITETPISPEEARKLPKDGYWGHIGLQGKLARVIPEQ